MNRSTQALIESLGGDLNSGMCRCPAHDDQKPSLHVGDGNRLGTVFVCFAHCSQDDVINALSTHGLWPLPGLPERPAGTPKVRSPAERRAYALEILRDVEADAGHWRAPQLLSYYFTARGIDHVPPTAMAALPNPFYCDEPRRLIAETAAMVFPVVTADGEVLGCHVTWFLGFVAARKIDPSEGPPRQSYGPISGGYIPLYEGTLDPQSKLVIGEGIENALSAAQLGGGLPAIAGISAKNLAKITPPPAREYIIAADHDPPGLSGASTLAERLVRAGHFVRIAVPPCEGTDWNDVLMERVASNGTL